MVFLRLSRVAAGTTSNLDGFYLFSGEKFRSIFLIHFTTISRARDRSLTLQGWRKMRFLQERMFELRGGMQGMRTLMQRGLSR
jgi:hypothetical protein